MSVFGGRSLFFGRRRANQTLNHSLPVLSQSGATLKLSGTLELATAGELRDALEKAVATGLTVTLDLSEAKGCDAAAFQALYAARRTALAQGGAFRIGAVSARIAEDAGAIGLRLEDLNVGEGKRDAAVV